MLDEAQWLLAAATRELTLFAGIGLLLGGIDDLAIDLLWLARLVWRRATVYRRHRRSTAATLPPPERPGLIAVFVPAWREADVIGTMLRSALARFDHPLYRIYVGTYPNDPATAAAVAAVADPRVRMVGGTLPGPTTKAECLNRLWTALLHDEREDGERAKAIVLHDAEDVVHPQELRVFDRLIERFDLVQLPVLPLIDGRARWVSGHYADEFAEAHSRLLVVREALGAGIPSAGVGCALSRDALGRMAHHAEGLPFDETSLTEDYEIGVRIGGAGRAAFVAMRAAPGAGLVAVRAYFPDRFDTAVRQKTRWLIGIALAGWDRLRWDGGLAERWMRLRDRRAFLAALILATSYAVLALGALCAAFDIAPVWPWWAGWLLATNGLLLTWRLVVRFATVGYFYGWREGLRAVPRVIVANIIAMAAARRALIAYVPGKVPPWDKTAHVFPETLPCD
ncbi:glycosyl transferase family protein [Sphingomonas nostoxanthinifaciens]|uniref:glycosyl transferase family protein n=1 Tax=Sphingomonas nostoxanthinifaciens TaxID=2872652 RepID=UPI001CC1F695|nr:glycosyl transferase family protein [Sphingomonas nostoxanthinifaciens]UAK24150.1 glycosyl transferase family protein [Sphingomonas nostoxanthinifaciens]